MATQDDAFARGWQHHQAGDLHQAEQLYRQILRAEPANARVWFVLGTLCQGQGPGRVVEAETCFRRAMYLKPAEPDGPFYLGNALLTQGRWDEARQAFAACLRLKSDYAEARINLGVALCELGKPDEALVHYRQAVPLRPDLAELHHNIGNVLRDQGKLEEAEPPYREALRLKPDYVKAHANLAAALVSQGRPGEAADHLRRALELQPDFVEGYNTLGAALSALGRLDEAAAMYQRAIDLKPDFAEAHWNLALLWLLRGDFGRGWVEFEWRWRCKKTATLPPFTQPAWDGSPLAGKTILLQEEQGLGDTVQFIRYAPLVKARGGTVVVHCQRPLAKLLAGVRGIDRLVPKGSPLPAFDVYAPLLSLPRIFGTTLDNLPAEVPYLSADPGLVEHWRRHLAPVRGFRVGIVWQGNPNHPWDRHRSIPLDRFEPLARVEGVRLISLQKGPGVEQLAAARFPVVAFGGQLDETSGPFMDSAAILRNLDLVVTSDTSTAHLAGALGVPVWVALCLTPDWRWLEDRADSPWYPTLRLFRQTAVGDWDSLFRHLAEALRQEVAQARPGILVEVAAGELMDKITILEIKSERVSDPDKLRNIRSELAALAGARDASLARSAELDRLTGQLKAANEALWDTEDAIRQCERDRDFGPRFLELARSVYRQNDRRAALKRAINDLLGSRLVEEKSYAPY